MSESLRCNWADTLKIQVVSHSNKMKKLLIPAILLLTVSTAAAQDWKDALKKKEIITFDEKDEPVILDPLFEYWLTKYYFER